MRRSKTSSSFFWLFAAPALLVFVLFNLGPMLESLRLSFTKYDVVSPPKYIGLRNYTYLLTSDPSFWPSVTVTAIYAAISVPLGLIGALGVALLLNRKVAGRGVFRTIYFLPSLLPAVASGVVPIWESARRSAFRRGFNAPVTTGRPSIVASPVTRLPMLLLTMQRRNPASLAAAIHPGSSGPGCRAPQGTIVLSRSRMTPRIPRSRRASRSIS